MIINIILIVVLLLTSAVGWWAGMGNVLKHGTKGIVGVLISIFICVSLGQLILNTSVVSALMEKIGGLIKIDFLRSIRIEIIIFYVLLFAIAQTLRIICVNIIENVFESDNIVLHYLNKIFGAIILVAVLIVLILLVLAVIKLLHIDFYSLKNSFLYNLYLNNPIKFAL